MVVRYAWSRRLSYDFFSLLCATHVRNGECVLRLFYVTLEGYSNVKSILLLLLTFFFFFCRHQILCFVFNHAAFASGSLYRYCSRLSAMLPAIVCDLVLSHSVFFRSSFLFWSSHSFANIFRRPSIGFFLPSMRCFAHFNLDRSLWNLHVHSILDLVQEKRFRETQKRKCEISRMKNEWASAHALALTAEWWKRNEGKRISTKRARHYFATARMNDMRRNYVLIHRTQCNVRRCSVIHRAYAFHLWFIFTHFT